MAHPNGWNQKTVIKELVYEGGGGEGWGMTCLSKSL